MGWVEIESRADRYLTAIRFGKSAPPTAPTDLTAKALIQLRRYFQGKRGFLWKWPLFLQGSSFELQVWQYLRTIPWGHCQSYQDVADGIGRSKAARAVGNALGKNPFPILIPCHRVIESSGKLGGFSPGVSLKAWLLTHEGVADLFPSTERFARR